METTSAGTTEKRRIVVCHSLMAAVKAIRITSNQKRNVETRVALKVRKKSVASRRQRDPVWGHSRAGTSIALIVFAVNSCTADAKAIGIDL